VGGGQHGHGGHRRSSSGLCGGALARRARPPADLQVLPPSPLFPCSSTSASPAAGLVAGGSMAAIAGAAPACAASAPWPGGRGHLQVLSPCSLPCSSSSASPAGGQRPKAQQRSGSGRPGERIPATWLLQGAGEGGTAQEEGMASATGSE